MEKILLGPNLIQTDAHLNFYSATDLGKHVSSCIPHFAYTNNCLIIKQIEDPCRNLMSRNYRELLKLGYNLNL